jgi:hypothetical protein
VASKHTHARSIDAEVVLRVRKLDWLRLLIQISGRSRRKICLKSRGSGKAEQRKESVVSMATSAAHLCTSRAFERAREHRGGNHAAHGSPSHLTRSRCRRFKGIVGQFAHEQCAIDPSAAALIGLGSRGAARVSRCALRVTQWAAWRRPPFVSECECVHNAPPPPPPRLSLARTYIHPLRQFISE